MTKILTTCQICGRAIKTVVCYSGLGHDAKEDHAAGRTDRIAHHGFQRPHQQGYQTGSCFGAKWRPYEVACDAIPILIAIMKNQEANLRTLLAKHLAEPPAKLQYNKTRGSWQKAEWVDVPKPDGFVFDPEKKSYSYSDRGGYDYLYLSYKTSTETNIRDIGRGIKDMHARAWAWKAPAAESVA